MKVLFVASECTPIVKVGGLGDVIGSLPKSLVKFGLEISVAIPGYQTIDFSPWSKKSDFIIHFNHQPLRITVYQTTLPGSDVTLLVFHETQYIGSGGVYFSKTAFSNSQDEINRFAVFDQAVANYLSQSQEKFDIIHAHDWHTGLLFHLLGDDHSTAKKVFTIHNLANQGMSALEIDKKLGGHISHDQLLSWDAQDHSLDLMLQGIGRADWITTVSPSYAKEILTPVFGEKLEEVLKSREGRLSGILNGIDYDFWNPQKDRYLSNHFGKSDYQPKRLASKKELQKKVGLAQQDNLPLFGFVGRLTNQKGLDLILGSLPEILKRGQLFILGKGDPTIEQSLTDAAAQSGSKMVYVNTTDDFHEDYEHLMYAACNAILVPSKFEPCGLVQMIAMHYGAIPIAHAVGGLKDSISDGQTGFLFDDYSSSALTEAIRRYLDVYYSGKIDTLIRTGMAQDFSWTKSAAEYANLYTKVLTLNS